MTAMPTLLCDSRPSPKDDVTITNSSSEISLSIPGSSSFDMDANCKIAKLIRNFPHL